MPLSPDRISRDIETIAGFSESPPTIGHSRPTFSPSWAKARDYIITQAKQANCTHRIDSAGNVFIHHASLPENQKRWLSGSHIDSVPTGGKYDGVIGIVAPLEVLRQGPVPLELVIWAEEEGTTFGLGMIGSRLAVGAATPASIANFLNRDKENFAEAGRNFGVGLDALESERFNPANYHGLIEIHAEQGPAMWAEGISNAAVTAIAGRKQFHVSLTGQANHAGSTPMAYRRDALVEAARIITSLQRMAHELGAGTVATVGKIDCVPNAINVIPGVVRFTIDLRSPDSAKLAAGEQRIRNFTTEGGSSVGVTCQPTEDQPPVAMDPTIVQRLVDAGVSHRTASGALHDAAILAPHLPTAMLFVASKDGISHNPAEFSRIEDIAEAATVLDRLVRT